MAYPKSVPDNFSSNVYVANLKKGLDDNEVLKRVFSQYGTVKFASISRNQVTNAPRGFGFVEFFRSDHADAAVHALDGTNHPVLGQVSRMNRN